MGLIICITVFVCVWIFLIAFADWRSNTAKLGATILACLFVVLFVWMIILGTQGEPTNKLEENTIYFNLCEFKPAPISPNHFLVILCNNVKSHIKYYKLNKNRLFNEQGELIDDIPARFSVRKVKFKRKGYEIIPARN